MKRVKPYLLLIIIAITDIFVLSTNPELGSKVIKSTGLNFYQMLGVIPPIFLLIGLLDVWVPREKVIRYMGENSGVTGIALSIFMGAAAAGPLYAAFPAASIMIKKGAKFSNILIFLGAWSTMKIPMFLFEMANLGPRFAITRMVMSFIGVLFMARLIDKLISSEEKRLIYENPMHIAGPAE